MVDSNDASSEDDFSCFALVNLLFKRAHESVGVDNPSFGRVDGKRDVVGKRRLHPSSFVACEEPRRDVDERVLGVHEELADVKDLLFGFGGKDELVENKKDAGVSF